MPLANDQQIFLTAAEGFIGLGMYLEADSELDRIDPFCRHLPEVLAIRLRVYRSLKTWDLMQAVSMRLAGMEPEVEEWWLAWAFATRAVDSVEAGRRILVIAVEQNPNGAELLLRLACYECCLGDMAAAKTSLQRCFELSAGLRVNALDEADLRPLWNQI